MRRIATHKSRNKEGETFTVITIYEENMKKEQIKKLTPYSKTHGILVERGGSYDFVGK